MTTPLADLRRLCEAIYGRRWQSAFARDLGVNPRTVRRWAAGDAPVPPWAIQYARAHLGGWHARQATRP